MTSLKETLVPSVTLTLSCPLVMTLKAIVITTSWMNLTPSSTSISNLKLTFQALLHLSSKLMTTTTCLEMTWLEKPLSTWTIDSSLEIGKLSMKNQLSTDSSTTKAQPCPKELLHAGWKSNPRTNKRRQKNKKSGISHQSPSLTTRFACAWWIPRMFRAKITRAQVTSSWRFTLMMTQKNKRTLTTDAKTEKLHSIIEWCSLSKLQDKKTSTNLSCKLGTLICSKATTTFVNGCLT